MTSSGGQVRSTGKTGTPVVRLLGERGHHVRALVRKLDKRAGRLAKIGAETVVGDYHYLPSIRDATKGVRHRTMLTDGTLLRRLVNDHIRVQH